MYLIIMYSLTNHNNSLTLKFYNDPKVKSWTSLHLKTHYYKHLPKPYNYTR